MNTGYDATDEDLYARVREVVRPLSLRYGHDRAAAEDLAQDVFLKVFMRIASFRGESSLKTWIYRIAVNEAHDARRWHDRHCGREISTGVGPEEAHWQGALVDTGPSPFERAALGELQTAIIAALARLDPRHRQALLLRATSGLPYRTIADMLHVPVATAKYRIFRARQELREELNHSNGGSAVPRLGG